MRWIEQVAKIPQPRGGYLPSRYLSTETFSDEKTLPENRLVSPMILSKVVTRLAELSVLQGPGTGSFLPTIRLTVLQPEIEAFCFREFHGKPGSTELARSLLQKVKGLDKESVDAVFRLCAYSYQCSCSGYHRPVKPLEVSDQDIEASLLLLRRIQAFWNAGSKPLFVNYPVKGGWGIQEGQIEFLAANGIYAIQCRTGKPSATDTLSQLLRYLMLKHTVSAGMEHILRIGFWNPIQNKIFFYPLDRVEPDLCSWLEKSVIGYPAEEQIQKRQKIWERTE